jgi:hypothetical protein
LNNYEISLFIRIGLTNWLTLAHQAAYPWPMYHLPNRGHLSAPGRTLCARCRVARLASAGFRLVSATRPPTIVLDPPPPLLHVDVMPDPHFPSSFFLTASAEKPPVRLLPPSLLRVIPSKLKCVDVSLPVLVCLVSAPPAARDIPFVGPHANRAGASQPPPPPLAVSTTLRASLLQFELPLTFPTPFPQCRSTWSRHRPSTTAHR